MRSGHADARADGASRGVRSIRGRVPPGGVSHPTDGPRLVLSFAASGRAAPCPTGRRRRGRRQAIEHLRENHRDEEVHVLGWCAVACHDAVSRVREADDRIAEICSMAGDAPRRGTCRTRASGRCRSAGGSHDLPGTCSRSSPRRWRDALPLLVPACHPWRFSVAAPMNRTAVQVHDRDRRPRRRRRKKTRRNWKNRRRTSAVVTREAEAATLRCKPERAGASEGRRRRVHLAPARTREASRRQARLPAELEARSSQLDQALSRCSRSRASPRRRASSGDARCATGAGQTSRCQSGNSPLHGDPGPRATVVVDLLVDGESSNPGRWHPKRMRAMPSACPHCPAAQRNRPCLGGTADKIPPTHVDAFTRPSVSPPPDPSAFDHGTSSRCVALVIQRRAATSPCGRARAVARAVIPNWHHDARLGEALEAVHRGQRDAAGRGPRRPSCRGRATASVVPALPRTPPEGASRGRWRPWRRGRPRAPSAVHVRARVSTAISSGVQPCDASS